MVRVSNAYSVVKVIIDMEQQPSRTAQSVALQRAVHQVIDDAPKILDDPIAIRLFSPEVMADAQAHPARFQTSRSLALRSLVLIRSRYAEDCLKQAVDHGMQQYLMLGAGWDTFAYRQPAWAQGLRIFEVDQPASRQAKLQRIQAAQIMVPPNVAYVPIDFETTALREGLRRSSFDFNSPAFISWLGVMVYLTRDAIDAVCTFFASLPGGSEIVLTFTPPPGIFEPNYLALAAGRVGEPWKTYFTPDALRAYLHGFGFTMITIPTPEEVDRQYIGHRQDGLSAPKRSNLAHIQIASNAP